MAIHCRICLAPVDPETGVCLNCGAFMYAPARPAPTAQQYRADQPAPQYLQNTQSVREDALYQQYAQDASKPLQNREDAQYQQYPQDAARPQALREDALYQQHAQEAQPAQPAGADELPPIDALYGLSSDN